MGHRIERVNELVKRTLGELIRKEVAFEGGLITITDVKVSPDLKNADVFFGVIGNKASADHEALNLLLEARPKLQSLLGREVILKYTPHLRFILDTSAERGVRVVQILDELERENPSHSKED